MTFEALVDYCRRDEWPIQADDDKRHVRSRFGGTNGGFNITMSVDEDRSVVLFLAPYYLKAPVSETDPDARLRLHELLLAIDYRILYGNFEYDITDGEVRYRLSVPYEGGDFPFETFLQSTKAMMWACDFFYPACQRVLRGGMSATDALASIESPPPADDPPDDPPAESQDNYL